MFEFLERLVEVLLVEALRNELTMTQNGPSFSPGRRSLANDRCLSRNYGLLWPAVALWPSGFGGFIADQFSASFIPQAKGKGLQASAEREPFYRLEERLRLMGSLGAVVRNSRTEMMDMMKADVSAEPLKNFRKFVVRTALQGSLGKVPILSPLPVDIFKLMLHVEKPHSTVLATSRIGN